LEQFDSVLRTVPNSPADSTDLPFLSLIKPHMQHATWTVLQKFQSTLDPLDIEGLVARVPLSSPLYTVEATVDEYAQTACAVLSDAKLKDRQLILAYLLSASFKDCSVFLRFAGGKCAVKLTDVDTKSIGKMAAYWELDRRIVRNFQASFDWLGGQEGCVAWLPLRCA
jgi:inositol-pentakisphosphate 2-kinase